MRLRIRTDGGGGVLPDVRAGVRDRGRSRHGKFNGPLTSYMMKQSLISRAAGTRLVSEQGTKMRRRSILHVQVRGEQGADGVDVGGYVTAVSEATMKF